MSAPTPLRFVYRAADEHERECMVTSWREEGHYVIGYDRIAKGPRKFRKDRVLAWLDGCETALIDPYAPAPTLNRHPEEPRKQILFTGFPAVQRAHLEAKAEAADLHVVKTATKNLLYLCGGPNAGPTKVRNARMRNAFILSESQFHELLSTGVLPDDEAEDLVI